MSAEEEIAALPLDSSSGRHHFVTNTILRCHRDAALRKTSKLAGGRDSKRTPSKLAFAWLRRPIRVTHARERYFAMLAKIVLQASGSKGGEYRLEVNLSVPTLGWLWGFFR